MTLGTPPKLYGVAIAAIPTNDGMTIFCTPIAVPKGNRKNFEILEELKFDIKWNDEKGQRACFTKLVDTLDNIVKLQQESCAAMGIAYRPVCLFVGDDSKKPIKDIGSIYRAAFAPCFSGVGLPEKYASPMKLWAERTSKKEERPDFMACLNAYQKLPGLLQQCTWHEGSYTRSGEMQHVDQMKPSGLDKKLTLLKEKIDRGEDVGQRAHQKLKRIARNQGMQWGIITALDSNAFAIPLPDGYRKRLPSGAYEINKEAERRFPSYCFYGWHPDYSQSFYDGFDSMYSQRAAKGAYRHIKLPMDPPNPPFTDPCADKVVEQFQIIEGIRKPGNVKEYADFPKIKEKVTALCRATVSGLSRHNDGNRQAQL